MDVLQRGLPVFARADVAANHFVRMASVARVSGGFSAVNLRVEVVEPPNPVTGGLQAGRDMAANESRATSNQDIENRIQIVVLPLFCLTGKETCTATTKRASWYSRNKSKQQAL